MDFNSVVGDTILAPVAELNRFNYLQTGSVFPSALVYPPAPQLLDPGTGEVSWSDHEFLNGRPVLAMDVPGIDDQIYNRYVGSNFFGKPNSERWFRDNRSLTTATTYHLPRNATDDPQPSLALDETVRQSLAVGLHRFRHGGNEKSTSPLPCRRPWRGTPSVSASAPWAPVGVVPASTGAAGPEPPGCPMAWVRISNWEIVMSPRNQVRRGSVLVIVAALAAVMMATFAVVISQVQSEVSEGELLVRDAQARIMLPSALSFVLESARLGQTFDGESFGWTDIRDGGIGPRGPRDQNGNLPAELTESATGGLSAWPAPGGIYRADMHLWNRTPYAIRSEASYNPVKVPSEWLVEYEAAADAAKGDTLLGGILGPGYSVNASSDPLTRVSADTDTSATQGCWTTDIPVLNDSGHSYHWNRVWLRMLAPFTQWDDPDHQGMLVPQPVTDDWDSYAAGDKTVRPASGGISWFRVYREKAADHDGDGRPWYDTVPLNGHGVFIITCGGGGTLGTGTGRRFPAMCAAVPSSAMNPSSTNCCVLLSAFFGTGCNGRALPVAPVMGWSAIALRSTDRGRLPGLLIILQHPYPDLGSGRLPQFPRP